jgi:hypothetical protein
MSNQMQHVTGLPVERWPAIRVHVGAQTSDIMSDDAGHDSDYVARQGEAIAAGKPRRSEIRIEELHAYSSA